MNQFKLQTTNQLTHINKTYFTIKEVDFVL